MEHLASKEDVAGSAEVDVAVSANSNASRDSSDDTGNPRIADGAKPIETTDPEERQNRSEERDTAAKRADNTPEDVPSTGSSLRNGSNDRRNENLTDSERHRRQRVIFVAQDGGALHTANRNPTRISSIPKTVYHERPRNVNVRDRQPDVTSTQQNIVNRVVEQNSWIFHKNFTYFIYVFIIVSVIVLVAAICFIFKANI